MKYTLHDYDKEYQKTSKGYRKWDTILLTIFIVFSFLFGALAGVLAYSSQIEKEQRSETELTQENYVVTDSNDYEVVVPTRKEKLNAEVQTGDGEKDDGAGTGLVLYEDTNFIQRTQSQNVIGENSYNTTYYVRNNTYTIGFAGVMPNDNYVFIDNTNFILQPATYTLTVDFDSVYYTRNGSYTGTSYSTPTAHTQTNYLYVFLDGSSGGTTYGVDYNSTLYDASNNYTMYCYSQTFTVSKATSVRLCTCFATTAFSYSGYIKVHLNKGSSAFPYTPDNVAGYEVVTNKVNGDIEVLSTEVVELQDTILSLRSTLAGYKGYTYNQIYQMGANSVTDVQASVNTLFGSIANVPITILNGIMSPTIFGIPIVTVLLSFTAVCLLIWVIKKLI